MNKWQAYQSELKKQKVDIKEVRSNNVKLWAEEHPFNLSVANKKLKDKATSFHKSDLRLLHIKDKEEVNALGAVLIANGSLKIDEILSIDYNWLALNFYNYENKDVVKMKELIYEKKYKLFIIYNWPVSNSLSGLVDKNAEMTRNMIAEQYRIRNNLKMVIQSVDESTKQIFIDFMKGTIKHKESVKTLAFYEYEEVTND